MTDHSGHPSVVAGERIARYARLFLAVVFVACGACAIYFG